MEVENEKVSFERAHGKGSAWRMKQETNHRRRLIYQIGRCWRVHMISPISPRLRVEVLHLVYEYARQMMTRTKKRWSADTRLGTADLIMPPQATSTHRLPLAFDLVSIFFTTVDLIPTVHQNHGRS